MRNLSEMPLFTFHAEIVAEDSQSSIGIDRDVEVLMYQKIVAGTLADNSEVVHKGLLKIYYAVEAIARVTCSLILELILRGICWGLILTRPLFPPGQPLRITRYPLHASVIVKISLVTSPFGVIVT